MLMKWLMPVVVFLALAGCSDESSDTDVFPATEPKIVVGTAHVVLTQRDVGVNACGPCAVFNALEWGDPGLRKLADSLPGSSPQEKVSHLISTIGKKPSNAYRGDTLYDPDSGMAPSDLVIFTNLILAGSGQKTVTGSFLDLRNSESSTQHVRRVFLLLKNSLDAGFPPIASFRSFVAEDHEIFGGGYEWHAKQNHFVPIVDLPAKLAPGQTGFSFSYLDSETGRIEYAFIYAEKLRPYDAERGDNANWTWLNGYPFLMAAAPTLDLETSGSQWHDRSIIVLSYAVMR
jgi:hypothetical protein